MRKTSPPMWPFSLNRDSSQAQGIVGWWPTIANHGNLVPDLTTYLQHGASNATRLSTPTLGGALKFTAASAQYVSIGTPATLNLPGEMSLAFWINPQSTASAMEIITACNAAGNVYQYISEVNGTSKRFNFGWQGANAKVVVTTFDIVIGTWYHVAFVRSGAAGAWTATAYINGVYNNAGSHAGNPPVQQSLSFGRLGAYNGLYLSAYLADIRLFRRALTAPEVHAMWNPATRWDLYYQPKRNYYYARSAAAAAAFNPAWARNTNTVINQVNL